MFHPEKPLLITSKRRIQPERDISNEDVSGIPPTYAAGDLPARKSRDPSRQYAVSASRHKGQLERIGPVMKLMTTAFRDCKDDLQPFYSEELEYVYLRDV